jgi:hypothetical protein
MPREQLGMSLGLPSWYYAHTMMQAWIQNMPRVCEHAAAALQ